MPLTARQERFCLEYNVDSNATQAAIRAGYKADNAHQTGYENLRKPEIVDRIAELRAEITNRTLVTIDRIEQELALIAFARADDFSEVAVNGLAYINLEKTPGEFMAAISSIKTKEITRTIEDQEHSVTECELKFHDKIGALRLLGQRKGMFPNKVELTGKDGEAIKVDAKTDAALSKIYGSSDPA